MGTAGYHMGTVKYHGKRFDDALHDDFSRRSAGGRPGARADPRRRVRGLCRAGFRAHQYARHRAPGAGLQARSLRAFSRQAGASHRVHRAPRRGDAVAARPAAANQPADARRQPRRLWTKPDPRDHRTPGDHRLPPGDWRGAALSRAGPNAGARRPRGGTPRSRQTPDQGSVARTARARRAAGFGGAIFRPAVGRLADQPAARGYPAPRTGRDRAPGKKGHRCLSPASPRTRGGLKAVFGDRGDGRGAGADKRYVDILDLARAGAVGGLQRALDNVPQPVDAAGAKAAAKGIERQFAVEFDAPVLDKVEGRTFRTKAVGFEPIKHRGGKAVIDLRDIDVLWPKSRALPGQFRRAAPALHIIGEAADPAGDP